MWNGHSRVSLSLSPFTICFASLGKPCANYIALAVLNDELKTAMRLLGAQYVSDLGLAHVSFLVLVVLPLLFGTLLMGSGPG